jgi:fucose 4-O-acetylase-like acetyltransferase
MKAGARTDIVADCRGSALAQRPAVGQSMPITRNRVPELDVLRGVAILGVLVLHSRFTGRLSERSLAAQALLARLFDWAVLAFFFSSGFLHARSVSFTMTVKKRFMSLLVPFFFYNVLYNLLFAVAKAAGWLHLGEPESKPIWLASGLIRSPAFQLYFLPYLFMVSVAICGFDKLVRRHNEWGYGGILFFVLGFYIWRGYPDVSHGPALDKLPLYLAAFLIGVMGRPFLERRSVNPSLIAAGFGIVLCILALARFPVVSLAVPPLFVRLAGVVPKLANSKLLLAMGVMSGSIYVWHTPLLLPAFTRLLARLGVPSLIVLFGSLALTLAACMVLRCGLNWFFARVLNRRAPRLITL